ncbi:hypothetical protein WMY93_006029 [Mugilogobius chulae]|uniref:Uncharacterized protein n=1 Tax=Mugilogobius chulae TaxID=88201 RepID=A0AAW0PUE7_9GOBI
MRIAIAEALSVLFFKPMPLYNRQILAGRHLQVLSKFLDRIIMASPRIWPIRAISPHLIRPSVRAGIIAGRQYLMADRAYSRGAESVPHRSEFDRAATAFSAALVADLQCLTSVYAVTYSAQIDGRPPHPYLYPSASSITSVTDLQYRTVCAHIRTAVFSSVRCLSRLQKAPVHLIPRHTSARAHTQPHLSPVYKFLLRPHCAPASSTGRTPPRYSTRILACRSSRDPLNRIFSRSCILTELRQHPFRSFGALRYRTVSSPQERSLAEHHQVQPRCLHPHCPAACSALASLNRTSPANLKPDLSTVNKLLQADNDIQRASYMSAISCVGRAYEPNPRECITASMLNRAYHARCDISRRISSRI